jgi:hypothetical protein
MGTNVSEEPGSLPGWRMGRGGFSEMLVQLWQTVRCRTDCRECGEKLRSFVMAFVLAEGSQ